MKNRAENRLMWVAVLLLVFIWGHSFSPASTSAAESAAVGKFLAPLLELFTGKGGVSNHLVRKLAHFAEFFALGATLRAILAAKGRKRLPELEHAALKGLAVAVADEGIQLLAAGRGAQLQDVLLDFCGVLFGMLCVELLIIIGTVIRRR